MNTTKPLLSSNSPQEVNAMTVVQKELDDQVSPFDPSEERQRRIHSLEKHRIQLKRELDTIDDTLAELRG